jgi:hypothetical protein
MYGEETLGQRERAHGTGVCRTASFGDSAVPMIPDTISYGALLMIINERLKLPRTMEEQQYFVDLANRLIQLYWQQIDDEQKNSSRRRRAA